MTSSQKTVIHCQDPLVTLSCPGLSFIFRMPNPTSEYIIHHGIQEKSLINWCEQFCSPDKIFLDIGAHVGTYALSLAPKCKKVYAFECQRENYYQLCGGVAINASWNVYPYHVELGSENMSNAPIYIVSHDGGSTTLDPTRPNVMETQTTEMKTLDSYGFNDIGFIKLDVEGHEESVLRGSVETLKRCNYPPFIFESWIEDIYEKQRESLHNFIMSLGYKIFPLHGYPHMKLASQV
jgi:FkbM family methyltransferase